MKKWDSFLLACKGAVPLVFFSPSRQLHSIILLIALLQQVEQVVEIRVNPFVLIKFVSLRWCSRQTLKGLISISNYITEDLQLQLL